MRKNIYFHETSFKNIAKFKDITCNYAEFEIVHFYKPTSFEEIKANNVDYTANFHDIAIFKDFHIENNLYFDSCSFKKKSSFENLEVQMEILFSGNFEGEVEITKSKFSQNGKFKKVVFDKKAEFKNIKFGKMDFQEVEFKDKAIFNNIESSDEICFLNVNFRASFLFEDVYSKETTEFNDCIFQSKTIFRFCNYGLFKLWNTKFKQETYFENTSFIGCLITSSEFNDIIHFEPNSSSLFLKIDNLILCNSAHVEIRNLKVSSLQIHHLINEATNFILYNFIIRPSSTLEELKRAVETEIKAIKTEIDKVKAEIEKFQAELKDTQTSGRFKTLDVKGFLIKKLLLEEKQKLLKFKERQLIIIKHALQEALSKTQIREVQNLMEIQNSILNNFRLTNCNFSNGIKTIQDSDITDAKFVNVNWGEISEKRICPNLFRDEPEKARDVYRQLKLAHDNQKDHITANAFYALEMKAYERVLRKKSWFNPKYFQQKLVFALHKFVSNFGQSWLRPLILIFLITIANIGAQTNPKLFFNYLLYFALILFSSTLIYQLILAPPKFIEILKTIIFSFSKRKNLSNNDLYGLGLDGILWGITTLSALAGFLTFLESAKWTVSPLDFLEVFASSLNIFKLFGSFSQTLEVENSTNFLEFHISSRFLHTVYAITVTFLIYQIIVAVRRQVRR